MTQHDKLVAAITAWDRKNTNHHALALALEALDSAEQEMAEGVRVNDALARHFDGSLLKALLQTEI